MGRARATVTRRLSTIAGFYKYAVEERSWTALRLRMSGGRGSTTSPTQPRWTGISWRCPLDERDRQAAPRG
jgi:hypothetical protein